LDVQIAFDMNITLEFAGNANIGIAFDLPFDRNPRAKDRLLARSRHAFSPDRHRADSCRLGLRLRCFTRFVLSGFLPKRHSHLLWCCWDRWSECDPRIPLKNRPSGAVGAKEVPWGRRGEAGEQSTAWSASGKNFS